MGIDEPRPTDWSEVLEQVPLSKHRTFFDLILDNLGSKAEKAKKLGVEIVDEKEFLRFVR